MQSPVVINLGSPASLDLTETLNSGQVFHWTPLDGGHVGAIDGDPAYLRQVGAQLHVEGVSEGAVRAYLGLNDPLPEILMTFPSGDRVLATAVKATPGLRIIRQPVWECLATFITSSLKQVSHIRQMSLTLRERFGQRRVWRDQAVYTYPSPEILAAAGEPDLRRCGLGYRAKSLALAATSIAEGDFNLENTATIEDDDEACRALCTLHGVGEKIAHCVLLFAFGRLGAFPIDVWVERVLTRLYARGRQKQHWRRADMLAFARRHFGVYAGYAQQYLFHYARRHDKELFGG